MSRQTFREYLIELMVSDDPMKAKQDIAKAQRNPEQYKREKSAENIDMQRDVQKDTSDPNRSEKLRILKLQQQAREKEKRLAQKEQQDAGVMK